tara:strand:- start:999 stop:1712 length:714 start_codon:yes stop_codon:yes gene_type:complete
MSFVDANYTVNKNMHGIVITGESANDLEIKRNYKRLKLLYFEFLDNLRIPMVNYVDANFEIFKNNGAIANRIIVERLDNDDEFFINDNEGLDSYNNNTINTKYNLEKNKSPELDFFELYRSLTYKLSDVIQQAVTEQIKITNLEEDVSGLTVYKNILEDREKLLEFINEEQRTSYLFSAEATMTESIVLKPWVERYLERHGAPGDGVFKSELLAIIIDELIDEAEENGEDFDINTVF